MGNDLVRIKEYQFDSVEEALKFEMTIKNIEDFLYEYLNGKINRPNAKIRHYYRRDVGDALVEMNMMNSESLSAEYLLILQKKSNLSAAKREFITIICSNALKDMFEYVQYDVKALSQFTVKGSKAKITVVNVNAAEKTIKIRFKKKIEVLSIDEFIAKINSQEIIYVRQ